MPSKMLLPPNFGVTPEGQEVSGFDLEHIFGSIQISNMWNYCELTWTHTSTFLKKVVGRKKVGYNSPTFG